MKKYFLIIVFPLFLFIACEELNSSEEEEIISTINLSEYLDLPSSTYNYTDIDIPDFFNLQPNTEQDNTPNDNQITDQGATLGRVLFYDKALSANNTISCSSCHLQEAGFSDPERFSIGFEDGLTGRNSMGISNARYYQNGHFFWDERAETLEEQVLMPIQDEIEMGLSLSELVSKVEGQPYYPVLFEQVYGDDEVTPDRISEALAQFVRSIVSYQSKYDVGRAQVNDPNQDFPNYSDIENLGKDVFFSGRGDCSRCHTSDLFVGDEARNNGLDDVLTDLGLGAITGRANDNGKFKVGSLRNIELTAPYMHDGRFETLEEVVDHYDSGVQASATLDNRLRQGNSNNPRRLNLSNQEKVALVAFMKTLTDNELANDEKFSSPFKDN
ncbi:MAG: cytochrome c peroxidase [Balneola sp.]